MPSGKKSRSNSSTKHSDNRPDLPLRTARRSNTKRVGERTEAAFLDKAYDLGFGVARPWGDSERYDFILDNGSQLLRVQVKGTDSLRAGAYETRATYTIGKSRAVYTRRDIDFFVGHVIPLDVWYIMPVEACTPAPMLRFYPHRQAKKMRLEKYREAWSLLEAQQTSNITIHAAADETPCETHEPCGSDTLVRQPLGNNRPGVDAANRAQRGPWHRPVPWPIPTLEILISRRPTP